MIFVEDLISKLKKNNIDFYTGVPDSILKNLSSVLENLKFNQHIIASNEGSACSIGIGYYLKNKKLPCIYLQNSGLSNAMNPLISIANKDVYEIPLLLIIGWRGSPKQKDEPQHKVKGKITRRLLNLMKINHCILRKKKDLQKVEKLIKTAKKNNTIVACLIEQNILNIKSQKSLFKKFSNQKSYVLRSNFIESLLEQIPKSSKIISTTGYTSRELMHLRLKKKLKKGSDFYMVGGMGHSLSTAIGYSIKSKANVFCLDGDGSVLMHLGSLRTSGYLNIKNLKHIILNNGSHESVGGQKTYAEDINFKKLSESIGFKKYFIIENERDMKKKINSFIKYQGQSIMEVKIKSKSLKNLPRPNDLIKIKKRFMA